MTLHDLSPQQRLVIAALLSGDTVSAAARDHGVHRATIHNWLRADPRFRSAMDQGRAHLQSALYDEIQDLAREALDRIRHIFADPDASPSIQLRAASLILKMAHVEPPPHSVGEHKQCCPGRTNPTATRAASPQTGSAASPAASS